MAPDLPPDMGRSWWLREALAADPGEPCPELEGDTSADVVILGGGYTGMWTAFHLKEREPSLDVVLLEQDICGGGPSGRNGGFVDSWWSGLSELCDRLGDDATLRLCRAGSESVRAIGTFCDEHNVEAWYRYGGDFGVASSESQLGEWDDTMRAAERLGVAEGFRELDEEEMRRQIDSPVFRGGIYMTDGATVQPARLARGIRRVLLERGVRICEQTPVVRFGAGSACLADTPRATVRAGAAVLALNAWASAWKRFRRTVMVRGSYILLTAPAPDLLEELGWTHDGSVSDYRAALHYVRPTVDGRLAFGIGGYQPGLAKRIGPKFAYDERPMRIALEDFHRMFPSFADVPIEAAWGGPIDVAAHHIPHFGTFDRGNVAYGHGYTGNGVGPAHLGGRILAAMALRADEPELFALPLVTEQPMRFPPEPIRTPGALVANEAIRRRDEAGDRGERPNPLTDFVAKLPRRVGYNLGP